MPKVLMPIGDATEVLDTFYPFFRLPEDGYEVEVAGPEARLYHAVLHEIPPNSRRSLGHHAGATGLSHSRDACVPRSAGGTITPDSSCQVAVRQNICDTIRTCYG